MRTSPRNSACTLSGRPGWCSIVSHALELAERAVGATEGDEADASVHVERSGFARFAASAVHQPTLIRDQTVTLRVVRDGRVGCARTNRTDDDGLAERRDTPPRRRTACPQTRASRGFRTEPVSEVGGYDEATAALSPEDQAGAAAAAIAAAPNVGLYGYYTSAARRSLSHPRRASPSGRA